MTRIVYFHPALMAPGGAELLCAAQARYLRAAGDDVQFVTFAYDPARWSENLQGIPVRVAVKNRWTDLFGSPSKVAKLRRRGMRASRMMNGVDLVVAYNFPCSAMLGASGLALRKVWQCNEPPRGIHTRLANPVLTARAETAPADAEDASTRHWRGELARSDSAVAALRAWDSEQVGNLDLMYAISQFSRDNARHIYGRCAQEIVYPIVRFPAGGRSRAGLDRSGLSVLVHSRLELVKNIDTVIRGFARFQSHRAGAHLHVVGEGAARSSLEDLAAQRLTPGAYTFHGYLPDHELRRVYDGCDVFALLPLDEPFGLVFPEAAAKGLLMIGPDHGGPLEILDGGALGWCVDAFDPGALADALERIWALSDSEVDRRRIDADRACRERYAECTIGPQLRRMIAAG